MADMLETQASIKARNKLVRDRSGQFRRPSVAIELQLAAERMRASLERDVPAMEHVEGRYWVPGHWSTLPNTDRLSVPHTADVLPLFDQKVAA